MIRKEKTPKGAASRRLDPALSERVIDALGGTSSLARICGITPSSVSEWRSEGITRPWMLYLREKFRMLPVMKDPEVASF